MPHNTPYWENLPSAKVQWWNNSDVFVQCPYCEEIHRHSFSGYDTAENIRASHCEEIHGHGTSYSMQFPFNKESSEASYEIDRKKILFVAAGADPTNYFLRLESNSMPDSFVEDMKNRHKWTEASEEMRYDDGFVTKKLEVVLSEMIFGNIRFLKEYLETSAEAKLLLHGVETHENVYPRESSSIDDNDEQEPSDELLHVTGKTALHFAACERYHEAVWLLLEKGADSNAADINGRVPLMEAALWGRLGNVELLLKHGADQNLECVRDGKRHRAVHFARQLDINEKERYQRSGGTYQLYKNTYERNKDRKAIVNLLGGDVGNTTEDRYWLRGFAFTKSPRAENLLTLITHFNIPNEKKTIAILYRGSQFHTVAAMSGWSHSENSDINIQVAGRDWTTEVRRICQMIGHPLEPHSFD